MDRTVTTSNYEDVGQPTRLRWGAVIAGGVLAVALLLLLSSLWMALGFGSEVTFIADNLEWFIGGSAIFCLFVGGWVAGRMSGVRGAGAGMAHGAIDKISRSCVRVSDPRQSSCVERRAGEGGAKEMS